MTTTPKHAVDGGKDVAAVHRKSVSDSCHDCLKAYSRSLFGRTRYLSRIAVRSSTKLNIDAINAKYRFDSWSFSMNINPYMRLNST